MSKAGVIPAGNAQSQFNGFVPNAGDTGLCVLWAGKYAAVLRGAVLEETRREKKEA